MRPDLLRLAVATLGALAPSLALAHSGMGASHGFEHGLAHPIGGLDHVAAMVTVGLFASQLGGRAVWMAPSAFMSAMAGGGALGMAGVGLPFVEFGVALSVIVLGAVVALNVQAPLAIATGLVGLFAIFHGYAHGAEAPETAGGLAYAAGFLLATAGLHGAGVGAGLAMNRMAEGQGRWLVRSAGGVAALYGVMLLGGVV
jgi:urease accessory protein